QPARHGAGARPLQRSAAPDAAPGIKPRPDGKSGEPAMAVLLSVATFFMTMLGGLLALRLQDRLHLILGFSAGAIIGVAFFDLIPEAVSLAGSKQPVATVLAFVAVGFVGYMILDRTIAPHG